MADSTPTQRPRLCPYCGYDLAGVHADQKLCTCPECGQPVEWGRWLEPRPPRGRVCVRLAGLPFVFAAGGAVLWVLGAALSETRNNVLNAMGVIVWSVCLATVLVYPFSTANALARVHLPLHRRDRRTAAIGTAGVLLALIVCSLVVIAAVLVAELL